MPVRIGRPDPCARSAHGRGIAQRSVLRGALAALLLATASAVPSSRAATLEYAIEMHSRVPVKYRLELPVEYPGEVIVEAVWSGDRQISLRLDPPGARTLRRSGPSPQRLSAEVDATAAATGPWILTVQSMPTSGVGTGTLTVTLPEPAPPPVEGRPSEQAPRVAETPRRDRDPAPEEVPPDARRLVAAIERFRSIVVDDTGGAPPDACRWHDDLLQYLSRQSERWIRGRIEPDESTLKLLDRVSLAIQRVDEFRTSTDSVISGPVPADERLREGWLRLRRERLEALESELDALLGSFDRGHAPELAEAEWPARLVSCLIACQRHFEERVRLGERNAINRELAQSQWDVLLAAGEALGGLSRLNTEIARSRPEAE